MIVGCVNTGNLPLQIDTLEHREFELVGILVQHMTDSGEEQVFAGFLDAQLTSVQEAIAEVAAGNGVEVDSAGFVQAYEGGDVEFQFIPQEVMSMAINNYLWETDQDVDQAARLTISLPAMEDGQIRSTLTLVKRNLENPERPFSTSFGFTLITD